MASRKSRGIEPAGRWDLWKLLSGVLGSIVLVGSALAAVHEWSPWAWQTHFELVAGISYQTAINQKYDQLLIVKRHIEDARRRNDTRTLQYLLSEEQRLQREIDGLRAQQQKIQR